MPISAHIKIEKEQARKWKRRAFRSGALFKYAWYNAVAVILLWFIVSIADLMGGQPQLAKYHALALFFVWVVMTSYAYFHWSGYVDKTTEGWEFDAILDDDGVKTNTKVETERETPWS